jgi:ATP-dependent Clp protease ATP-binding subunit ClpB
MDFLLKNKSNVMLDQFFEELAPIIDNKENYSIDLSKLFQFENDIQKRLIGQEEAIRNVSGAIKRSIVGLNIKKKPIGSFIFCGPTGVGKTEMAKTLAKNLYEKPEALVRFDMSEYMDKYSISKMIGTTPGYIGYDREGVLTEKLRENPKCVLLFDEIEKSDKQIMDLFLQVLDEGYLRDSKDNFISFMESIIILTSNIGASFIFEFMKNKISLDAKDRNYMNSKIMKELLERFRPEFINRLDQVVIFQPLVLSVIEKILSKQLEERKKLLENNLNINLVITNNAFLFLLKKGFNLSFGARQVSRALEQYFETPLVDFIAKTRGISNILKNIKVDADLRSLTFKI